MSEPDFIDTQRNKFWFLDKNAMPNCKHHRLDGPAIEWHNGDKWWFYKGKSVDCNNQIEFERWLKLKAFM